MQKGLERHSRERPQRDYGKTNMVGTVTKTFSELQKKKKKHEKERIKFSVGIFFKTPYLFK